LSRQFTPVGAAASTIPGIHTAASAAKRLQT
jgi:hypothetical protein